MENVILAAAITLITFRCIGLLEDYFGETFKI